MKISPAVSEEFGNKHFQHCDMRFLYIIDT
jgi:hypothetical protein